MVSLSYSKNVSVVDDSSVTLSPSEVDPDATDVVGFVTACTCICVYLSMVMSEHAIIVVPFHTLRIFPFSAVEQNGFE